MCSCLGNRANETTHNRLLMDLAYSSRVHAANCATEAVKVMNCRRESRDNKIEIWTVLISACALFNPKGRISGTVHLCTTHSPHCLDYFSFVRQWWTRSIHDQNRQAACLISATAIIDVVRACATYHEWRGFDTLDGPIDPTDSRDSVRNVMDVSSLTYLANLFPSPR